MAHGDYYNPANKSVTDGTVVYADDVNKINTAVDSALEQVAYDLDVLEASLEAGGLSAKNWATEDQGTRPDPILDLYSAKAYALEAKDWASASGTITEASTGAALAGSASAKTKAAEAATSALDASRSASFAAGSAITATNKAGEALSSANAAALSKTNAGNSAISAAASAAKLPNATTAGANKLITTNSSGNGWEYPSITTAGKAILDDVSAAEQRTTLGLGNVANVDTTNANNITSGTLAEARIPSTIARDSEVAALDSKVAALFSSRSRKNLLINGGFDVWQRGTSFADSLGMYTADRWFKVVTSATFLVDYTYIHGQEEGLTNCMRLQPFSCQDAILLQRVEGLQRFSNKTVTLSFWAKSDDPEYMSVEFVANFGTGGTPSTAIQAIGVTKVATTASWAKYTVTAVLPSMLASAFGTNNDSSLDVNFWYSASPVLDLRTGVLGQQNGVFYLSNVQLEFGDTATDFEYRHPAEELALCKYYFERIDNTSSVGSGYQYSNGVVANARGLSLSFTSKRIVPVVTYTGYQVLGCTFANVLVNTQSLEVRVNTTGAGSYRIWDGVFDIDAEI